MTLLFQEDDCAPDAYEYFCKKFKAEVGIEFKDWKAGRTNISEDAPYETILQDDTYKVSIDAGDPYWKLYKIIS